MPLESFYPVFLAQDVAASARFYTEHMGFAKVFESDWYVSLKHKENPAYGQPYLARETRGLTSCPPPSQEASDVRFIPDSSPRPTLGQPE
jgi:catechol 2,3-dioxygenase-like lactoylglutathione lyase family enzyme